MYVQKFHTLAMPIFRHEESPLTSPYSAVTSSFKHVELFSWGLLTAINCRCANAHTHTD
jgi:hypothetical protein